MIIAAIILLVLLYSLVSRRMEGTVIMAPILFTAAGLLVSQLPPQLSALELERTHLLLIAVLGLVMLLFSDAAHINLAVLKGNRNLPVRLLSAGMLLTILLGAVFAWLIFFDQLTLWEAGILAAILAPTDAGLGQVIVRSPRVPLRIRQALDFEAGVNDGLSVPFLLFFIALAGAGAGGRDASLMRRFHLRMILPPVYTVIESQIDSISQVPTSAESSSRSSAEQSRTSATHSRALASLVNKPSEPGDTCRCSA